ncbi:MULTISPECIES: ABC transporter permease [unclassified Lentimicrobium]|uniref:ABC transporter permease n=1 Tax=unclassified Lentimicrobium TaxID=2677434 RepID=UPI0015539CD9|nr:MULTISPECIES: FtsX-like permease family protein [unclassified Lentimicrobium]NPD48029.1 ABC transporter permease [Lentimicrobium sp. S6]NPD86591.1 ABC transporter permease [Lentimicrobium sp. L6]
MKTSLIIAWRNIWRNKRRSLITMAAIFMAVFLSVFMRSMQKGTYSQMIQGGINQVGYIEIHKDGYWDNQNINKAMVISPELRESIRSIPNVKEVTPRLSNFGLCSSGNQTKAGMVIGANPELENRHTALAKKIIWGNYLSNHDNGILVAENLAKFLKLAKITKDTIIEEDGSMTFFKNVEMLQDSLVIISSGYQGNSAFGLFPIRGIISLPTPQQNGSMVYMSLQEAQYVFSPYVPNLCTSISLDLHDPEKIEETQIELSKTLGEKYEVMTWGSMLAELVQAIQLDNAGGIMMMGLLYVIVGFGLLGTIIMISLERRKEMAVMVSVGMRKSRLTLMMIFETIVLGIGGVVIGILLSLPFVYYLNVNPILLQGEMATMMESYNIEPILPFSMDPMIFFGQGIVILLISFIAALYPIYSIMRIKPTDAR